MGSYQDVRNTVDAFISSINSAFKSIFDLLSDGSWFKTLTNDAAFEPIMSTIKATAITLCMLLFLIDFFRKSMDLQWVKWENVLMFFIKLIFAKICIDNVELICQTIYDGFSSLAKGVSASMSSIIPPFDGSNRNEIGSFFWLSNEEVSWLYPDSTENAIGTGWFDFMPLLLWAKVNLVGIAMTILVYICLIIAIGRIFELVVYTVIAPIPMASFACDGLQDIGKGFLKSYVAVCIQAIVLMVMITAYTFLHDYLKEDYPTGIIEIFVLAVGVMQSGAWSKRICGAM